MRFMLLRKADASTEAGAAPTQALIDEMARYNEEMVRAGVMVSGDGLQPTSRGARVTFAGGKPTVTDGPFTETKELIAGAMIVDVRSLEEAIDWVKRWPAIDGDGAVEIEVRPLYELSDLGSDAAMERHARIRERLAKR
jgi:hypothetical protein